MTRERPLRVIQWATGNIGMRALREASSIIQTLRDLAGVLVYDSTKDGLDAGVLAGGDPDWRDGDRRPSEAVIECDADCVLYMPRTLDVDDLVALLEHGTNVVTTCGDAARRRVGRSANRRVEQVLDRLSHARCVVRSMQPGAAPASSRMRSRSRCCRCNAASNWWRSTSSPICPGATRPHLLFELMRASASPHPRPTTAWPRLRTALVSASALCAHRGARTRPPAARSTSGRATARLPSRASPPRSPAGELEAGTVAAQRTTIVGRSKGVDVVRFRPTWYCTADVDPAWDLEPTGWRVKCK